MRNFINKHFFELFFITWLFGTIFYVKLGLDFIDELCAVLLISMYAFYLSKTSEWRINKVFVYNLLIFLFYLGYSFYIKSNTSKSILMDFFIQLKPYLAFFCVYQLSPTFTKVQKKLLRDTSFVLWGVLCVIGFPSLFIQDFLIYSIGHQAVFAGAVVATSLIYLYCSDYTLKDKFIFIFMLSLGILSARSKFYGFLACAIVLVFYFSSPKNLKFNLKNVVAFVFMFTLILIVAWQKIDVYFVQGITGEEEKDEMARLALYATSISIFEDYMPFGSGLASFATHASSVSYSPIYSEYGIDGIWGLSKNYNKFITDTFYPSLAQFGIVGVLLYVLFWIYILRKAFRYFQKKNSTRLVIMSLLIIGFLAIENVANATLTSSMGLFMMMFLGLIMSEDKNTSVEGPNDPAKVPIN